MSLPDDLNLRGRMEKLSAAPTSGVPGVEAEIIAATPCDERRRNGARWRTVDLWSSEDVPWQARLTWSGGMAGQREAFVTVAHATRVCIHAASLTVKGQALANSGVSAWAAIADGQTTTENEYSVRGTTAPGSLFADIPVPPFAKFVRLELDTETEYALSSIKLVDGWNTPRNVTRGDRQPSPGLPVGDSKTVSIATTNAVAWRVTFLLNL